MRARRSASGIVKAARNCRKLYARSIKIDIGAEARVLTPKEERQCHGRLRLGTAAATPGRLCRRGSPLDSDQAGLRSRQERLFGEQWRWAEWSWPRFWIDP